MSKSTNLVSIRKRFSDVSSQQLFGYLLLAGVIILFLDLIRLLVTGAQDAGQLQSLLWNGIIDSLYIGLAAIGLSMTYSILRFANFAHGDLFTAGAFSGWTVAYLIGGIGLADFGSRLLLNADGGAQAGDLGMSLLASPLAIFIGLIAAGVLTAAIAVVFDRVVFKRMRNAGGITLLIASVGVAFVLRYVIAIVYTQDTRGVVASPAQLTTPVGTANVHELTLVILGVLLIIGVHVLLQHTKLGKSMRAMSDNRALAQITGIPTERVVTATWLIGGGLAGVAGYLYVLDQSQVSINIGWFLLLLIFAAVILGGIGSVYGSIAGALIIGITVNVSLVWIPADLNEVTAFLLMIAVLIARPEGLFGGVETA